MARFSPKDTFLTYWRKNRWHRFVIMLAAVVIVLVGGMYGVAQWYIQSEKNKPLQMGVSFIPAYASSLGLNPEETMDALTGIGVKHFRLVSYWNQLEPVKGQYDFSLLDWQFEKAEQADAKVMLTLGLRQPRWPECHMPDWARQEPKSEWEPQLKAFIKATVERYKDSPALQQYQLENEYFLKGFGICTDFDRRRLIDEYNLVKQTDPSHPIVVGRSNNAVGFPVGQPRPDEYSISVYKRVWDAGVTRRYLEYPFPAWFYGYLAGVQKIFQGRDMMISELQAEAWPARSKAITATSLEEQNKSFNAQRFRDRIEYGKATGMRQIDLWGAEYWYYRLKVLDDPSVWNVAKEEFSSARD